MAKSANKITVYDYDKNIKQVYELIKKEMSESNAELIFKYDRHMATQTLSKAVRLLHLKRLLSLTRLLNMDWKDVTQNDIEKLVYDIMNHYSENGQETNYTYDHKKVLKIFFRWYKLGSREFKEVGDPPETKIVKMRRVKEKLVREDLITDEELQRLIKACGENLRERTIISVHAEANTRPGEILTLQIKHVKFDEYGAKIHVDGKTGARPIRILKSSPYLAQWLAVHPYRDDPEAPLWIKIDKNGYGQSLTQPAFRAMYQNRARKAGLSKKVFPYLFRHTGATKDANYLTEAQMKKRMGWSPNSKMPAKYIHLVDADVDEAYLEHHGVKKNKTDDSAQIPIVCRFCTTPNAFDARTCSSCGKPLDLETAMELEEKQREEHKIELEDMKKEIKKEIINELKFFEQKTKDE